MCGSSTLRAERGCRGGFEAALHTGERLYVLGKTVSEDSRHVVVCSEGKLLVEIRLAKAVVLQRELL